jgi:PKD repeat protein
MKGAARRSSLAVLVVLCGAVLALAGANRAETGIYNPIPADASGDPQDAFVDDDYLFAYVTSDIKGGRICIVNASGAGDCDSPAWGDTNAIVGIGTVFTLIENPTLHVGTWRLRTENSLGEQTGLSQPFTVRACPECKREVAAEVAQEFKNRFRGMQLAADGYCFYQGASEVVQEARGIVGEMTAAHGNVLGLKKRHDEYRAGKKSFVATTVPVLAGFVPISFPAVPGLVNPGEEKAKEILKALVCALDKMWDDIALDPPDPAFDQVQQPTFSAIDPLGSAQSDALALSVDRQTGFSLAILKALERYQGALAAGNQAGVHRQSRALSEYTRDLIDELRSGADALRAYATRIDTLPEFSRPVLPTTLARSTLATIYARVRADGFTASELAELTSQGYSAEEIAAIRTHFDLDPAAAQVGVTLGAASRAFATTLEQAIPTLDAFQREAAAVADRTNVPPVASFNATPDFGPAPLTVRFTSTSTSPDSDPLTTTWGFGDFGSGSGTSVSHTYQQNGTFVATLKVCDAIVCSSTSKIITVGPVEPANQPPVALDDTVSAQVGQAATFTVLANDSDADGDPLKITGVTDPPHGSVGCFITCSYSSDPNYTGPDSFEYTIVDGKGGADTATVSVTVTALANRAPIALSDALATSQGVAASLNVLANDSDADGDSLTVASASFTGPGGVSCLPTGICTFTPAAGFAGTTVFSYTISDGRGATANSFVRVTVNPTAPPPNQPPVAVDDSVTLTSGESSASFNVLANDSDANGDAVYLTGIAGTPAGTLTCSSSGACTYTPQNSFAGDTGFTYSIADGRGGTDSASVAITVVGGGARPVAALVMSVTSGSVPANVFFDASASHDPDGDVVSWVWDFGDGSQASGPEVSHTYVEPGFPHKGTLTVTDDDGLTATLGFEFAARAAAPLPDLPLCGDQDDPQTPIIVNCPDYGPVRDVQLYRVEGTGDVDVTFDFVFREAAFNNELAVVPVDDAAGTIDGRLPESLVRERAGQDVDVSGRDVPHVCDRPRHDGRQRGGAEPSERVPVRTPSLLQYGRTKPRRGRSHDGLHALGRRPQSVRVGGPLRRRRRLQRHRLHRRRGSSSPQPGRRDEDRGRPLDGRRPDERLHGVGFERGGRSGHARIDRGHPACRVCVRRGFHERRDDRGPDDHRHEAHLDRPVHRPAWRDH